MRHNAFIMGMPVGLDIPGCENKAIFEKAFNKLRMVDEVFSPYKEGSELSRYQRGELTEKQLSRQMKKIIKACRTAEEETEGFFSAWASGFFDPSGYVKGWAIKQVSSFLTRKGFETFCISAGGDVDARSNSAKNWHIGLQHPVKKDYLTGQIIAKNLAVATSGTYERGLHIINPRTHQPADELLSLTVVGPDILDADVLATAAFVLGHYGVNFVGQKRGYEALAVNRDLKVSMTSGMSAYLT